MRHKCLLVTVNEWLKSVLNCRSYPKITGYPFFSDHPVDGDKNRRVSYNHAHLTQMYSTRKFTTWRKIINELCKYKSSVARPRETYDDFMY